MYQAYLPLIAFFVHVYPFYGYQLPLCLQFPFKNYRFPFYSIHVIYFKFTIPENKYVIYHTPITSLIGLSGSMILQFDGHNIAPSAKGQDRQFHLVSLPLLNSPSILHTDHANISFANISFVPFATLPIGLAVKLILSILHTDHANVSFANISFVLFVMLPI